MGFIYTAPLSVEGVFAKFDTDGNGKISKEEAKAAENRDIFTSFKVKKGMTLNKFEEKNRKIYSAYEKISSMAYKNQQERVKIWMKMQEEELKEAEEERLSTLEKLEEDIDNEKMQEELGRILFEM